MTVFLAVLLGFHLERDGPAEPVQGHGGDSGGRLGSASFRPCKYVDAYCFFFLTHAFHWVAHFFPGHIEGAVHHL